MSRRPLELPPEAVELVEQVRGLEDDARRLRAQLQADLAGVRKAAADERAEVERDRVQLARDREALEALLESRVRGFGFIADAWADYERARADRLATALQYKKHPAKSAAKEVRAKGRQLADLRRELKRTQWVLALYEFHFPWLTELRDFEEETSYVDGEPELDGAGAADSGAGPSSRAVSRGRPTASGRARTSSQPFTTSMGRRTRMAIVSGSTIRCPPTGNAKLRYPGAE